MLLHEVRREALRGLNASDTIESICRAVADEYEVHLDAVGLLRFGGLPRTTSGKIERYVCRSKYLDGEFDFIDLWKPPRGGASQPAASSRSRALPAVAARRSPRGWRGASTCRRRRSIRSARWRTMVSIR